MKQYLNLNRCLLNCIKIFKKKNCLEKNSIIFCDFYQLGTILYLRITHLRILYVFSMSPKNILSSQDYLYFVYF